MKGSIHVSRCAVACALALAATTAFAEKPDKWVRYVESTGSAWVDTGIEGRWNTKIECQVEWMNLADSAFVASRSGDNRIYMCYCLNDKGEITLSQGGNATVTLSGGWNTRFEKNRIYNFTSEFSATNGTGQSTGSIAIDGYSGWSKTVAGVDSGLNLYIFANNQGGGTVGGKSKSRCYGLKIWQGPKDGGKMVLVRNFQPCMRGGRAGLYDVVSDTIFYSITSTDLICDEKSEVPDEYIDYVESTGDAAFDNANGQYPSYIDTGIIGRSGTKVVGEFAILQDEDGGIVGSRSGSTRCYMLHSYHGKVACGHGTFKENSYTCEYGKKYGFETIFTDGNQVMRRWADGVTNTLWSGTLGAIDTGLPLYVFTCNVDGKPNLSSTSSMSSKSRCYKLEIWQDDVMVRQFKPCLKNGVAGLYDTVSGRIFYSSGTPLGYNTVYRENVKPKDVIFVEYIESDGNNTLDTGVPARSGIRAKGVMMWTAEDENGTGKMREYDREHHRYLENTAAVFWRQKRAYLGARNLKNSTGWFHMLHESNAILLSQYGSSGETNLKNGSANVPATVGVTNSFDVTFNDGLQTMEWNGVKVLNATTAGAVNAGDTLHLFSSSYWRWRSAARCYGLQIWQDGSLVRDFKPCIYKGRGALYDVVTRKVYRPSPDIPLSRTGPLVLTGDERPRNYVDYVETDGTMFIDTGVTGKAGTIAEFKDTSIRTKDGEECLLGSFGSDARCYFWYYAWGYTLGIGYGDTYWRPKKNDPYTVAANSSDPDVYKLNKNATTHARVSLLAGEQTVTIVDDDTSTETLLSRKDIASEMNTERNLYLFAKNDNAAGTPKDLDHSRLYWMKIYQGNSDGTDMELMRDFRPARLRDGTVVLWEMKENKPYFPRYSTLPQQYRAFSDAGQDGPEIRDGMSFIIR